MNNSKLSTSIGNYRWRICTLVFFATTINYLDRNVLGLLKQTLSDLGMFGEDPAQQEIVYSYVVMAFQLAYASGLLLLGNIIDKIGTKRGYFFSLLGWSLAAIGHAFSHGAFGFGFWRAALGLSESGNFPAANKTIAEWFPKKERALATGLYNSGAAIGSIIAPLSVPYIAEAWGWQWAFIIIGAVGLIWLFFWQVTYRSPKAAFELKKLSYVEYAYIHSDIEEQETEEKADEKISWFKLLSYRQTWAFAAGKFFSDPIWWFFLFWLPSFLEGENKRYIAAGMEERVIEWPIALAVIYVISMSGSILGGWIPKQLINKGMNSNKARKMSMFIYALIPISVVFASRLGEINTWLAVLVIALACAAHQAWMANLFATVSDMFPKKAVASVTGIGGMAGSVGGLLIAWSAGLLLAHYTALGNTETGYSILFVICGLSYIVGWFIMHLLSPHFNRIKNL